MKTTGIILLVIGCLSTLGGIIGTIGGREPNFAGLTFVVIGGFLMYSANRKKEEAEKKKQWEEGKLDKD
jgi:uncharacterized membrane protein YbaN (DUF454 family)